MIDDGLVLYQLLLNGELGRTIPPPEPEALVALISIHYWYASTNLQPRGSAPICFAGLACT